MINVDDYGASARLLAATTLRNVLGTKNLGDILSDREAIAQDMQGSKVFVNFPKSISKVQNKFSLKNQFLLIYINP